MENIIKRISLEDDNRPPFTVEEVLEDGGDHYFSVVDETGFCVDCFDTQEEAINAVKTAWENCNEDEESPLPPDDIYSLGLIGMFGV